MGTFLKVLKDHVNTFSCNIFIEHCHNHGVNSLEALSFKLIFTEIKMEIELQSSSGLTRSQVYNEIYKVLLRMDWPFILIKATDPTFQEGEALNSLFINFCHEKCGGRNSAAMFNKLWKELTKVLRFPSNFATKIIRICILMCASTEQFPNKSVFTKTVSVTSSNLQSMFL